MFDLDVVKNNYTIVQQKYIDTLFEFLSYPLNSETEIISKFCTIPGAIHKIGNCEREEFVYISGTRRDRATLVAHCDTVFDVGNHEMIIEDGIVKSSHPDYGIGGDDRAGCAMLWLLKDSGHNILVVNSEESCHSCYNRKGSVFLAEDHPDILKDIQSSSFMMEFDRRKYKHYTAYDLPVSQEFRTYIESKLHIEDDYGGGWTDIIALSSSNSDCCCAANFCVGYYHAHRPNEYLVIDKWCKSFEKYKSFLEEEQRRFTI